MADISMCRNENNCPKADSCHRVLAPPKENDQVYIKFHNICGEFNQWKWCWEVVSQELVVKEESDTVVGS